jgi:hypothetical protein
MEAFRVAGRTSTVTLICHSSLRWSAEVQEHGIYHKDLALQQNSLRKPLYVITRYRNSTTNIKSLKDAAKFKYAKISMINQSYITRKLNSRNVSYYSL